MPESGPLETVQNLLNCLGRGALEIRILDPSTNEPAWCLAYSQQNNAVRNPPMCRKPVGLGANRVRTVISKPEKKRSVIVAEPRALLGTSPAACAFVLSRYQMP